MDVEELASEERAGGGWIKRHLTTLIAVGIVGFILAVGWIPRISGPDPVATPTPVPETPGEISGMSPLPDVWPVQNRLAIQMCTKSTLTLPACDGRESVLEDANAILERARELRISGLSYVDGKLLRKWRLDDLREDGLPTDERIPPGDERYFTGSVPRPSSLEAAITIFREMSGVARVARFPVDFWEEHADVRVELCGRQGCPGRGPATEAEKTAILARIDNLLSAEAVYVEDATHLKKTIEAMHPDDAERRFAAREPYGDSIYIKLSYLSSADAVRMLGKPPGMRDASTVRPVLP
ncbi:hypothetical protein [Acrocarpospora catenulata]|uniref:hypothetical protein n=1 Tax=Acrocarpospora catenulata TaxID=2836182 RepID=UPI001BDA06A4|nr:hypothetical protein [Acrocarpospora catenulata]